MGTIAEMERQLQEETERKIVEMRERVEKNKEAIIDMLVKKTLEVELPQHISTTKTEGKTDEPQ